MQTEVSAAVTCIAERTFEVRASCAAATRSCAYIHASVVSFRGRCFWLLDTAMQSRTPRDGVTQMQHCSGEVQIVMLLHSMLLRLVIGSRYAHLLV